MSDQQALNRELMTCSHGISGDMGSCWWCKSIENKPVEKQIDVLKERFDCLLAVVKMLIKNNIMMKSTGNTTGSLVAEIIGSSLITSGADASKPSDGGNLAFYFATDTDTIYQRRDNSWIDISFSRPSGADVRITDISTDSSTGSVQVTDTA